MFEKPSFSKRSNASEGRTIDLDEARVSSMADEGGTAGATMDAQEQGAALDIVGMVQGRRWTWLTIGVVAGCAAFLGALFAARTRSRRRSWFS